MEWENLAERLVIMIESAKPYAWTVLGLTIIGFILSVLQTGALGIMSSFPRKEDTFNMIMLFIFFILLVFISLVLFWLNNL